jgi:hypothetical protein
MVEMYWSANGDFVEEITVGPKGVTVYGEPTHNPHDCREMRCPQSLDVLRGTVKDKHVLHRFPASDGECPA